ncbi:DUF1882 domain-containing protein [Campylobacter jejuni]|nr:DUF1882 domain-containing protein [Campylobacter jejuni]
MLKKTKIVATVGPASEKEEILRQMIINGVNVFRLNFSHGTHEYHKKNLDTIRRVAKELHTRIGILQDISGPKIRTGELKEPFELKKGDRLDFYRETILGEKIAQNHYKISINQKSILDMLKIDEYIYLYDGSIRAKVVNIDNQKIETIIENDGFLNSNKGINFPNTKINIDVITQKDKNDLLWGYVLISPMDMSLIKIIGDHYYIRRDKIVNKITHRGRLFFDKFERVDAPLNLNVMREHAAKKIVVAHDLITKDNKVENIVFDYNGFNAERFYHRAQLILREEGFINFTAYKTKTPGHLHLYIHKGHTALNEGYSLASKLSMMFASKMPVEWKVFPSMDVPREFNILILPYEVYQKERGSSWSKHM